MHGVCGGLHEASPGISLFSHVLHDFLLEQACVMG